MLGWGAQNEVQSQTPHPKRRKTAQGDVFLQAFESFGVGVSKGFEGSQVSKTRVPAHKEFKAVALCGALHFGNHD